MVADKMIGFGYAESEPDIDKMRSLHKDWWILFAADDVSPVFEIIDFAKTHIGSKGKNPGDPASLRDVMEAVEVGFERKRVGDAANLYLPTGWSLKDFNDVGHSSLPDFEHIRKSLDDYSLYIELLVAGFENNVGYLFDLVGSGDKRGIARRWDIPGFQSIGSGATMANFMMLYRNVSPRTGAREALYYALEAKYYGEQASGVGGRTDLYIARPARELLALNDEETIEEKLIPICQRLEPADLHKKDRDTLNALPELGGFPLVEEPKKKTKAPNKAPLSIMQSIVQKSKGQP
jgi:hypothetical protein